MKEKTTNFPHFCFGFGSSPLSLSCRLPLTTHQKFPGHEKMKEKTTNFLHFCFVLVLDPPLSLSLSCRLPLTTHQKFPGHEKMKGGTTNFPHFGFGSSSLSLSLAQNFRGTKK